MNERIKELLVKTGMQFRLGNIPTHIDSNGTHTFNEFYVYDKFDPEKFAELIVKKFDDILVLEYLDCVGNKDKPAAERIDILREKVKSYFGVGE